MTDELYAKKLPLTIRIEGHEDRKASIHIAIEISYTNTQLSRKELVVRLTDDKDPFFFFTLHLSEEDFQGLKVQQGLLVDFGSFPQKFIDLLQLCLKEEQKEVPKFVLHLVCNGSSLQCAASLNVIETNAFKHLTHLSLKFLPGTDADVKRYLADCLKALKDQNAMLLQRFESTESDLNAQLRQAKETLASQTEDLTNIKTNWTARITEINNLHNQELNMEKEKELQTKANMQQKYDRDKKDLEQKFVLEIKKLENHCQDLETTNKDLTDFKYQAEARIQDMKSKINILENENGRVKLELQNLRADDAALVSDSHEKDKQLHQLKTRVAVLEQEVKSKDELIRKNLELFESEQNMRRKSMEEVDHLKQDYAKERGNRKKLSAEVMKGNNIIKSFQAENQELRQKVSIRARIAVEQEKLLKDRQLELEKEIQAQEELKQAIKQLEEKNKELNDRHQSTVEKLEESQQILKSNQDVISWLQKRLTEYEVAQLPSSGFDSGSTGPTSTNFHRPSPLMNTLGSSIQSMSYGQSPSAVAPGRQTLLQYQMHGKSNNPIQSALGKNCPFNNAIQEDRMSSHTSPPAAISRPKPDSVFLDPKYLQQGDENVRTRQIAKPSSPPTIRFSSAQNRVQLGKDFNAPSTNISHTQQTAAKQGPALGKLNEKSNIPQPALMSSYFPTKAS